MDQVVQDVLADARDSADDWFPELAVQRVSHVQTHERPWTRLHVLEVVGARGRAALLAKEYRDRPLEDAGRPRLGRPDDRAEKHALEFAALRAAHETIHDPQAFAVRALAHLPQHRTLVVEKVDATELRDHLLRQLRPGSDTPNVRRQVVAAGRWLAAYHRCLTPDATLRSNPAEVGAAFDEFADFVAGEVARPWRGPVVRLAEAGRGALPTLPSSLPLGAVHGDAAARNVLVAGDGRVAMIDPLGRRRVPVFEDVATFTVTLRTSPAVALATVRPAAARRIDGHVAAYVAAYGEASGHDMAPLEVFEALVLLDRLAASVSRESRAWRKGVELVPLLREAHRLASRLAAA